MWGSDWAQQLKEDLRVDKSNLEAADDGVWSNQDLDPTPAENRNWTWINYGLYFVGSGFNSWTGGSSVIGIGLGWKTAVAVIFITQTISAICCVLIGRPAARYHLGFPAMSRTVYGMYGSYYQVIARAVLAAVWYATQMYNGASYLEICFKAIFGRYYTDIPNHVPEGVGYSTRQFLTYFVLWVLYIPFIFRRPYQLRWFFNGNALVAFPAVTALFIYCMAQAKGNPGLGDNLDHVKTRGNLDQTGWMVIYAMTGSISNGAAYIESFSDMARYSNTPNGYIMPTFLVQSFFNPLSAVFGILGTSTLRGKIGQTLWKPWDIMSYMLEQDDSVGTRLGVFLLAFLWIGATVCQNFSSNLIPFGSDIAMLWPRHLTMTRGFVLVHLLAWCICPWKLYASAETFLNFMGAYGIFMGPAVSIMICEYFCVSRGNIFIPSIYIGKSTNPNYWYTRGWNVQAYIAYMISVGICFAGFLSRAGVDVPDAGVKLGYLGWFLTFPMGFIVYYIIVTFVWPHQNVKNVEGLGFEEKATGMFDRVELVEEENTETERLLGNLGEEQLSDTFYNDENDNRKDNKGKGKSQVIVKGSQNRQ